MECPRCGAQWPVDQSVPSYDAAKYYGEEVTQETMQELVGLAEEGHWRTAARAMFKDSNPEVYDYIADLNRASWIPILPLGPDSTVLDVSSGLGAVTHALALNYHHVVSVEPVVEMLRFTKVRLEQEDLKNVDLIHTTLDVLPFYKDTFDLIVLNGVLEWVHEWRSSRSSREAQIGVLRDLRRLLKPHGVLVIGSENRIGYTSFLPRAERPVAQFRNVMPPWLESLYRRLKKPGFYRSLVDPAKRHRTNTHSPHGYFKLLRQAGFPSIELWWPPDGFNSPHTILSASNRAAISSYCDYERRYKDRFHGFALARQVRHWAIVHTGLIHMMFPDVIMVATPASASENRLRSGVPLLAAFEKHPSCESEWSGQDADVGKRYCAESVTTHPYQNKAVIKVVSGNGETHAVVKVANVRLPGSEIVHRSYQKLQRLDSSLNATDPVLAGSTPSLLGSVRVGSLVATMETSARGSRLVDLILDRQYFDNRDRVRRHLERITSWLIASRPTLDALGSDGLFEAIPAKWFLAPDGGNGGSGKSVPERFRGIQHGDFYPENIFIDGKSICVIDWDGCATGYPPLFDWFCLVTGLYYSEKVWSLPRGQTVDFIAFRQTYFSPSWFSELILSLSQRLCASFGLDSGRLLEYFLLYIVVRYRQFLSRSESAEKHYWGPPNTLLYRQYYEFLLKNQKQCCFWKPPA